MKDAQSSPLTGWVFSTLVYDKDAPGVDVWDKMMPLGAMWGNDPASNSAQPNPPPLTENWINPAAPAYARNFDAGAGKKRSAQWQVNSARCSARWGSASNS